jgi:hypothetical protein
MQSVFAKATPDKNRGRKEMKSSNFPPSWDEQRVRKVIDHYERQSEDEAVAEDEAAYEDASCMLMKVPKELVSKVRELIAKRVRL